jgi:hypothetical protein
MHSKISRRALVKGGLIAGALVPAMRMMTSTATAADLTPLDPKDPTAQAFAFSTDTNKVDGAANPTHKATQKCGTCMQFQGKATDARAACTIFPGHTVPQGGWCKVWVQKS